MKHNIGDLVAIRDRKGEDIKLGYISRITKIYGDGYYVYFFEEDRDDIDYFYDEFVIEKLIVDIPGDKE
jgi:hypothetical protein